MSQGEMFCMGLVWDEVLYVLLSLTNDVALKGNSHKCRTHKAKLKMMPRQITSVMLEMHLALRYFQGCISGEPG